MAIRVTWSEDLQMSNTFNVDLQGGGATPLIAGQVEVTCRVSVACTYGAGKN